jgi:hypothetical protein
VNCRQGYIQRCAMNPRLAVLTSFLLVALPALGDPAVAALFDQSQLHDVVITMSDADWEKLRATYLENTNYDATLRIDGEIVTNSTIRSRGSGTRNPIKPGLRADFNRKVKSQTFRGFKTLVLDNMYNDASFLREQLAFAVFVCRHDGRMFDTQENNLRRIGLSQQVQTRQP